MFDPKQFRELIKDVLTEYARLSGYHSVASDDAVELLMLTAAQESHLGTYLRQMSGPARGVFQIEPATHGDLMSNFLRFKPELFNAMTAFRADTMGDLNLRGNLPYQIIIARLVYFRKTEPLPSKDDVQAMAQYWKKHYNTPLGKGTVEEAVRNYKRLVKEEKV